MQRDNYLEISTSKPVDYNLEEEHHHKMHSESEYDDLIPMGTIVCTAKGSPCCTDNLHCRAESGIVNLLKLSTCTRCPFVPYQIF